MLIASHDLNGSVEREESLALPDGVCGATAAGLPASRGAGDGVVSIERDDGGGWKDTEE